MGKPNATDEEVLAALRAAQCMDIIEKFPDGVHTVIGSQGIYLSGGETQRLAIARAMLKNAPVLILTRPPPLPIPRTTRQRCRRPSMRWQRDAPSL